MEADSPLNNTHPAGGGLPDPSSMNFNNKKKKNNKSLIFILAGAVGMIVLIIVVLMVVSINNSKVQQAELQKQYDAGLEAGKKEQSLADIEAQSKDVRVYKASPELGSFQVPIPRAWSWGVEARPDDGTFSGKADQDYINLLSEYHTFNMQLTRDQYSEKIKELDERSKDGKFSATDITVSGIKGRAYIGVIDENNKKNAELVVVPLREKTLVFSTDDYDTYGKAFNNVLAGVKLNP